MNPGALRRQLADAQALYSRTQADEQKILQAAVKRHDSLQGKLDDLRAAALSGSDEDEDRYMAAVHEIGQLNIIMAKSRAVLAEA